MPTKFTKFRKLVLPAGQVHAGDNEPLTFDESRLEHIAAEGNRFLKKGRIPVPYAHAERIGKGKSARTIMPHPVTVSPDPKGPMIDAATGKPIGWRSDLNAGFVTNFAVEPYTDPRTGQTTKALVADLEIPGDEKDYNTPAGKFGTSIREVSLGLRTSYRDGDGETYTDFPFHVAAVTAPVVTTQPDFALALSNNGETFTMLTHTLSQETPPSRSNQGEPGFAQKKSGSPSAPPSSSDNDDSDGGEAEIDTLDTGNPGLAEVIQLLAHPNVGINLPGDTGPENFIDRLRTALTQLAGSQDQQDDVTNTNQPPKGSELKPPVIAMSQTTTPVASTAPSTNDAVLALVLNNFTATTRAALQSRIATLVLSGRVTQEYADQHLTPKAQALVLSQSSLNDKHELIPTAIEETLSALEALPAPTKTRRDVLLSAQVSEATRGYAAAHGIPIGEGDEAEDEALSDEDVEKLAKTL